MSCCVVLTRLPMDIRMDDSAGKASNSSSSSRSHSQHNPDLLALPNARTTAANDSQHKATDGNKPTGAEEAFKEPWTKVFLQAKERSKRSTKKITKHVNQSIQKKSVTEKDIISQEITSLVDESSTASQAEEETANCQQSTNSKRKLRERKVSCPSQRKTQRASSVEWDWSGSDSGSTPKVPQNKKKRSTEQRKRTTSVDGVFSEDNSDSDNGDKDQNKTDKNSKKWKHKCHLCNKFFRRPFQLRSHLYVHLGPKDRPFRCDEEGCTKTYAYKIHLERHKSSSHSDLVIAMGNIMCPSEGCDKIIATASGLKRHMHKMHSEESFQFTCPQCNKKFKKSKQLRYHIAEHDGQPPLKCTQCNAGAYSNRELNRHMKCHKTYPCNISGCDQVFTNYPAFQKHLAEHNRCFSSLRCAHCNKQFTTKWNLRNHVATHLEEKPVFKCPYEPCPRVYYHERNLKAHYRLRHEKVSSFTCSWEGCDKLFLSKRAYTKHIDVHKYGLPKKKRKEGQKARRKDAGKPRRSMATMLTGVKVPREMEQELLENKNGAKMVEPNLEDSASSVAGSDYTATRNLLNASKLKADLQAKHCLTDSSAPKDGQPSNNEGNCDKTDLTNSACDEQYKEGTQKVSHHLPEENEWAETTSLVIDGTENPIADLTGKLFVVGVDGMLIEVQESLSEPNQANSKLDGTFLDGATCVPEDQILQKRSGKESEEPHQDSIMADQTGQCELHETLKNKSTDMSKNINERTVNQTYVVMDLCSKQTDCADSLVQVASNGETCILSATLCAETIVQCQSSNAEREVLLVIPKTGQSQSMEEVFSVVNSDAVMKALSGDVEVYSMAEKSNFLEVSGGACLDQQNEVYQEHLKKISINDPSVSNILQPLIQNLANQPDQCVEGIGLGVGSLASKDDGNVMKSSSLALGSLEEQKSPNLASLKITDNKRLEKSEESKINSSASKEFTSNLSNVSEKSILTKSTLLLNPAYLHNQKHKRVVTSDRKPNTCNDHNISGCPEPSCTVKHKILNPAYMESIVQKFAGLICNESITGALESVKHKPGLPVKQNLQGPTQSQDLSESDESSASELDDSRSDDSGSDDDSDWNDDHVDDNDHASDGGNGDDEGEEEDDDEAEEQVDEEDEEEEEEEDEDDGYNDGAGQLNEGNDNNNNNDGDNNEGNSDGNGSDREIDPASRNGHCTLGEGADFGVDRAFSPSHAVFEDSDAGRSAQSDDLVIVIEDSESEACSTMNNGEEIVIREHSQEMYLPKATAPKDHTQMNKPCEDILSQSSLPKENASGCKPLKESHLNGNTSKKRPRDHNTSNDSRLNENSSKAKLPEENPSNSPSKGNLSRDSPSTGNSYKDGISKEDRSKDGPSNVDTFKGGPSEEDLSKGSPKEKSSKVCNSKRTPTKSSTVREIPNKDDSPERRPSPVNNRRRSTRIRHLEAVKAAQREQTATAVKKVVRSRRRKSSKEPDVETGEENSADVKRDDSNDVGGSSDAGTQNKMKRKQSDIQRSAEGKKCTMKVENGSKSNIKVDKQERGSQEPTKGRKSVNRYTKDSSDSEPTNVRKKKQTNPSNSKAKIEVGNVVESDSSDFEPRTKRQKLVVTSHNLKEKKKGDSSQSDMQSPAGKSNTLIDSVESEKRKPKQKVEMINASGSSDSDIPQPRKRHKHTVSDTEDSDTPQNCNETDSDDPCDPSWKPGDKKKKANGSIVSEDENSDTDLSEVPSKSSHGLADPFHVSIQNTDQSLNSLKTSPASPSQDPLRVRYEGVLESLKKSKNRPIACKQLSESAWISVLRLASKAMKLSPSAADE